MYLRRMDPPQEVRTVPGDPCTGGFVVSSSDGKVSLEFPEGFARPMLVAMSRMRSALELPFPLPPTSHFTYAVDLQDLWGDGGHAEFGPEEEVILRIENTRCFAPGTLIPVGYFDDQAVLWRHDGTAFVSDDGAWVEYRVRHFSTLDLNFPV